MSMPPEVYDGLTDEEAVERIRTVRPRLGKDLLILGHHYQRDEVIQFADLTGDSYALAVGAAERTDTRWIVFCGVHFMAETADILGAPHQKVILPDLDAGCSMADMADHDQVQTAWEEMASVRDPSGVVPITYVNSSAAIKAFVGERGGAVCTSSNADAVYDWALAGGKALFFLPDQHLGRNVGIHKGLPPDRMELWDPAFALGGLDPKRVARARVLLWKGHCQVHQRFHADQISSLRRVFPDIRILVHWECSLDVVQQADDVGSTSRIIRQVEKAPPGSVLGIGTELHLVARLARRHPDKKVLPLVTGTCVCSTMNRIDPQHLCWVLEELAAGRVVNEIHVPPEVAAPARLALRRMLEITSAAREGRSLTAASGLR